MVPIQIVCGQVHLPVYHRQEDRKVIDYICTFERKHIDIWWSLCWNWNSYNFEGSSFRVGLRKKVAVLFECFNKRAFFLKSLLKAFLALEVSDYPLKNLDLVEMELRQIHESESTKGLAIVCIYVVVWQGLREVRSMLSEGRHTIYLD